MKLTYGNQTIDLFGKEHFPDGPPEKVVVSLSGGCDSSSLTYLIGTNFPNIDMYPFHTKDEDCPIDTERAIEVHQWLQNKFPKLHDLKVYTVSTSDPVWQAKAKEAMASPKGSLIVNGKKVSMWGTLNGCSKALQNRDKRSKMSLQYDAPVVMAMTSNPPVDVQKERGFYEVAERKRDPGESKLKVMDTIDKGGLTYQPYLRNDKKFVAGVFKEHNLMDSLYPLTKSCAWSQTLENCGKCFWCNEKEWAFED